MPADLDKAVLRILVNYFWPGRYTDLQVDDWHHRGRLQYLRTSRRCRPKGTYVWGSPEHINDCLEDFELDVVSADGLAPEVLHVEEQLAEAIRAYPVQALTSPATRIRTRAQSVLRPGLRQINKELL